MTRADKGVLEERGYDSHHRKSFTSSTARRLMSRVTRLIDCSPNMPTSATPCGELSVDRDLRERGYVVQTGPHDFRGFRRGEKTGTGESLYLVRVLRSVTRSYLPS